MRGVVSETVIDEVIIDGSAGTVRNAPAFGVWGEGIGVVVYFRNRQRAVEHEAVDAVGKVAQASPDAGDEFAVLYYASFAEAVALGGFSHKKPERERLAWIYDKAVYLAAGKSDVLGLAFLQCRIDAWPAFDESVAVGADYYGQRLVLLVSCKMFVAEEILQVPPRDFFRERYFICRRTEFAEEFSLSHFLKPASVFGLDENKCVVDADNHDWCAFVDELSGALHLHCLSFYGGVADESQTCQGNSFLPWPY